MCVCPDFSLGMTDGLAEKVSLLIGASSTFARAFPPLNYFLNFNAVGEEFRQDEDGSPARQACAELRNTL